MGAAHELGEAGAPEEGAGAGVHPQRRVLCWHNPPLVELLAWQRPLWCCRQRVAGGEAELL